MECQKNGCTSVAFRDDKCVGCGTPKPDPEDADLKQLEVTLGVACAAGEQHVIVETPRTQAIGVDAVKDHAAKLASHADSLGWRVVGMTSWGSALVLMLRYSE